MPTRADPETLNALIAEAVALCENAQDQFKRTHTEVRKAVEEGRSLTQSMINQENRARAQLSVARTRLVRRQNRLR